MIPRLGTMLLAAGFIISLLTACGDTDNSSSEAVSFGTQSVAVQEQNESIQETEGLAQADSFSMPYNGSYGWDPYSCKSMENQAVMDLIYEGLFTQNQEFEAEGVLCSGYTLSDDGLTYTLSIDENATFSDGSPVESGDVLYSLAQAQASELYGERFADVGSYEGTDLHTVVIHMNNPNDRLPCMLDFAIIPNLSSSAAAPIGSGPFQRDGEVLSLNLSWWQGAEKVQFSTVKLYSSSSAEDTRDNFEIDNVDLVYNDPQSSSAATFHSDYELWNSKNTVIEYIGFNMTSGVCTDSTIRKAIVRAIDRSDIAETVYQNYADATELPVHPYSSMYDSTLAKNYQFDAKAALEMLLDSSSFYLPEDDARRTDGPGAQRNQTSAAAEEDSAMESLVEETVVDDTEADAETENTQTETTPEEEGQEESYNPITMIVMSGNPSRIAAAQQAAEDLEDVGFTVTVTVLDEDEFYFALNDYAYDLFYTDVCLSPDLDIRSLVMPGGSLNYGGVSQDSKLETLLDSALENSGNHYDLYQYVMDQAYLCPILFQNNSVFTSRGVFQGLNPAPGNVFYQIENITVH